jgi:hypothetical protein
MGMSWQSQPTLAPIYPCQPRLRWTRWSLLSEMKKIIYLDYSLSDKNFNGNGNKNQLSFPLSSKVDPLPDENLRRIWKKFSSDAWNVAFPTEVKYILVGFIRATEIYLNMWSSTFCLHSTLWLVGRS